MLELYFYPSPNGLKPLILLEECRLDYVLRPVDILRGEQFRRSFLALNPNNRIPVIVDHDGPGGRPITLFESAAILQYLGEKSGRLLPRRPRARWETLQWLAFQAAGVGPMFGQCGHFLGYAPRRIPYAIERYRNETLRLYGVMDRRLREEAYLAGRYSIADVATWPWVAVRWLHRIDIDEFPGVKRWFETIGRRPAVQRGMALLAEKTKIGSPDARTREVFFGATQLRQGRKDRS